MKTVERLKSYRERRNFRRTSEPAGEDACAREEAIFVIQKHAARKHHYDFRLQVNNVLKSWAVPKGPSTDPAQKRLAIATEDHPLEYAQFEGIIPKGEYGAGKVIVWDTGTYRNITEKAGTSISIEDGIEHGHIAVWLDGKKLRGGFALNRFRRDRQDQWFLVKIDDQEADRKDVLPEARPESVLTGRTLEEVSANQDANDDFYVGRAVALAQTLRGNKERKRDPMPSHVEPMLASLSNMPRDADRYAFEYKWDGIRALCYWNGEHIRLDGRNEVDITYRWPELTDLGKALGAAAVILDGEIVALDSKNRVSFATLSRRMHLSTKPTASQIRSVPIVYMIFDILYLRNRVLMHLPYENRRSILKELRLSGDKWQTSDPVSEDPEVILEAAVENGMEGLVAKRLDSKYRPGRRTRDWLKIKAKNKQEFVIGGWIPMKGSVENGVGSLLVGYYDDEKQLIFAGKVGTGFTDEDRAALKEQFKDIARKTSPFAARVADEDVIFVKPSMVGEIEFREWTDDGRLRHPSFRGLRQDKEPSEIVRETPRCWGHGQYSTGD